MKLRSRYPLYCGSIRTASLSIGHERKYTSAVITPYIGTVIFVGFTNAAIRYMGIITITVLWKRQAMNINSNTLKWLRSFTYLYAHNITANAMDWRIKLSEQ